MPFIAVLLLALPVRLAPRSLGWLAFGLWLLGGVVLLSLGTARLLQAARGEAAPWMVAAVALAALAIGIAKGRVILRKTARRNIDRLAALTEGRRPIHVYGLRSWVVIGLMTGVSIGLTLGGVPPLWRGMVNVAIGSALAASSLNYLPPLRAGTLRSA
jgi:NCAIR mutase (PurE)-related protein